MLDELALVPRRERIAVDEPLGEANDAELEAPGELGVRAGAARHLDAAAADVNDDSQVARGADAVQRRTMDEPCLFRSRDHPGADAGLARDGLQEFAAVFRLARRARGRGDDLIDLVRLGQAPEFREHLERRVHCLRCEGATAEAAGAQPDHFLLAVHDLKREVGPHAHHDHVERIGADVDGGQTDHGYTYNDKPGLNQPEPVTATRHDLLRKRLQRFVRALRGIERGDSRAVHVARVASRRLREILPVLQIAPEAAAALGRRLRKVTSELGAVRDLDVLAQLAEELRESRRFDPAAIDQVVDRIASERSRVRRRMGRHLPPDALQRLARKLDRLRAAIAEADTGGQCGAPAKAWRWAVQARVARRAASLRASLLRTGALYLPDRLHAVRIDVKKLRYALELSSEIAGSRRDPDVLLLERAQDLLGRMHDTEMLIDRVRQVQASAAAPALSAWRSLDLLITALENSCRRLHGRYVRERAAIEALCERLGAKSTGVRLSTARRQAG